MNVPQQCLIKLNTTFWSEWKYCGGRRGRGTIYIALRKCYRNPVYHNRIDALYCSKWLIRNWETAQLQRHSSSSSLLAEHPTTPRSCLRAHRPTAWNPRWVPSASWRDGSVSQSVILTASRVAITSLLMFLLLCNETNTAFQSCGGDLLLHHSGVRRAAAYAGAAHRRHQRNTCRCHVAAQRIDASHGLQRQPSQVRLWSGQRVTDHNWRAALSQPRRGAEGCHIYLVFAGWKRIPFLWRENTRFSSQVIKADFIKSKILWKTENRNDSKCNKTVPVTT